MPEETTIEVPPRPEKRQIGFAGTNLAQEPEKEEKGEDPMATHCEHADWYDGKVDGLGRRFRGAVKATIEELLQRPMSFPEADKDIRRAAVQKPFPYGVYFFLIDDTIHVLGVLHDARDPRTWQKRV